MDIQQGNIFTPAQVAALRPGMTEAKVVLIFGSPLLKDPFHADRWDYIYTMRHNGKLIDKRHIALFFKNNKLVRIDDGIPADAARFNAAPPIQTFESSPESPPMPSGAAANQPPAQAGNSLPPSSSIPEAINPVGDSGQNSNEDKSATPTGAPKQ